MTDEQHMQMAIEQAALAKQAGEWPFGNVIVSGDRIIAQNRVSEKADKTVLAHSELKTLNDAFQVLGTTDLSDCTIYCSNEPCLMCAAAIFQAKIRRVVISVSRSDLPHLLRERKLRIDDIATDSGFEVEIVPGVLKDKVLELFTDIKKDE